MSDELSNALAGLAEGLGTTTGELWAWMQGYGIDAYAKAMIAELSVGCAIATMLAILGLAVSVIIYRRHSKEGAPDMSEGEVCICVAGIGVAVISMFVLFCLAPELFGWLASPEGMVISELFGVLQC